MQHGLHSSDSIYKTSWESRMRSCTSAKLRFKDKWRKWTSRKQPGTFKEITKKINQLTTGWINYYGIARMKRFILDTQQWFNHRLRQLIWKRWKKMRIKYRMLRSYGINHDDTMKLASSRRDIGGYLKVKSSIKR